MTDRANEGGARKMHDRGAWPVVGPIDPAERDLAFWDQRTDALMWLLSSPGSGAWPSTSCGGRSRTWSPRYEQAGNYERWLFAIETLMIEKGILTPEEIERKAADLDSEIFQACTWQP